MFGGREFWCKATLLIAIGAAGCGDALVSGQTYETPLLSIRPFVPELFQADSLDGLSIGIVWVDPFQLRDDIPQPADGIAVKRVDRDFTVDLFTPPPAGAIRRIPDPATHNIAVSFAFGEIVVYADQDGDGKFSLASRANGLGMLPPDAYAGSASYVVIYLETPAQARGPVGAGWFTLFEKPGYRLAFIDCGVSLVNPPVKTLGPDQQRFGVVLAPALSADRIVTRECLSSAPVVVSQ